jgi:phage terminase large subunit
LAGHRQFLFGGLDDTEKLKSLTPKVGVITDVLVEEATETDESDIDQLYLRMRGQASVPKRLHLGFNPIDRKHWIFRRWFKSFEADAMPIADSRRGMLYRTNDVLILRTTHWDNVFLDQQDRDRIESYKDTNPFVYSVYGLGEWGIIGNLVFTNWVVEDLKPLYMSGTFDNFRNGMDFGYTNSPTCLVHTSMKGDDIYVFDGLYEKGLSSGIIAERVKPIVGRGLVRCDSEDPRLIDDLKADPLNPINAIKVDKPKDSVLHGILWLQGKRVHIDKRLQWAANEAALYQWLKDKYGEPIDKPMDAFNHFWDALRYAYEPEMTRLTVKIYTQADRERRKQEKELANASENS